MSTVPVVAIIRAKPGKEKALADVLKQLVAETHKEPGCVRYALHTSQADARDFVFVERWKSAQDLQSHLAAPHIAEAMARKEELIDAINIMPLASVPVDNSEMETF